MTPLDVDRRQIAAFVDSLFRYADSGTFVSLRAFLDNRDGTYRYNEWPAIAVNGSLNVIVDTAFDFASECAAAREAVVFAPPVATFENQEKADDASLANGLCITVELDSRPARARETLGDPTAVIASGGLWSDPETGEIEDKLHLHWRLAKPTRTKIEHDFLKECRKLAAQLVGGDPTSMTAVHPLRWPGSLHRKDKPRLCHIVEHHPEIEITLADALNRLRRAVERIPIPDGPDPEPLPERPGEEHETAALVSAILTAKDYHDPIAKLAMRYLLAGMPDGQVVTTLRGIMLAVPAGMRDYKGGLLHKDRWQSRYNDVPRAVTTARVKIGEPPPPPPPPPPEPGEPWPEAAPLLKDELVSAPTFPTEFLPGVFQDFCADVTLRMQCPIDLVAIPLIIAAATAIGSRFRLSPKAADDWTERPCLWGGLIIPVGWMKSPAFNKALQSLRYIQADFHNQNEIEIEAWQKDCARAKRLEKKWKAECDKAMKAIRAGKEADIPEKPKEAEEPDKPKMRRILTGDATQEALVDLIKQNPAGLLLFRDELSGFFDSFNQYRNSGAGADRQFYLQCHAGGSWQHDRRVGSVLIDDLYLNVCGGVQPGVVRKVLEGGDLDGMTARFSLMVWPDLPDDFSYIDSRPNHFAEQETTRIVKKLLNFEPQAFSGSDPAVLSFDDEAQQIFVEWYTKNQKQLRSQKDYPALRAHLNKYPGLFARLAIVHHLIRYALDQIKKPTLVDVVTTAAVESFLDGYLEPHARRIYAHLGSNPARDGARRIGLWITQNPQIKQFTARDVRQHEWSGLTDQKDVAGALDYLENIAGWIRPNPTQNPKGGRPTITYTIHPSVRMRADV